MLDPERVPLLVLGILTVIIGVAVLLLDVQRRANRAFGAIAMLRGLTFIAAGLVTASQPQLTGTLFALGPYLLLPIIPLAFYFWTVFPRPRGSLAFSGSGWATIGLASLLVLVYAVDHRTVYSMAAGGTGTGFQNAAPGWIVTSYGPLSVFVAGVPLALSLIGLVYAWEYVTQPASRQLHGLVASGFILNGIFDGGLAAAALIEDGSLAGLSGYALAFPVLRALALLPAAVALGMIMSTQREEAQPSHIHWVLPSLAILAMLSGPLPIILGISGYGLTWHSLVILSLWRLVMPVTVGYALIRSGMLEHVRLPWRFWRRDAARTASPRSVGMAEDA